MPFHPPVMPLLCHVYRGQGTGPTVPRGPTAVNVPCALQLPRGQPLLATTSLGSVLIMRLVLAARTDVRAQTVSNPNPDAIEVPAGSGRFYAVLAVDDNARGFPNEFRVAIIRSQPQLVGWWPWPLP